MTNRPRRITALTDAQRAAMDAHADEWIGHGWSTRPADWDLAADAMRRCYEFAGIPWHGRVVRVSSPLVLSVAAPTAAYLLARGDAVDDAVRDAVGDAVRDAVHGAVDDAVRDAVGGAVRDAVHGAVGGAVGDAVGGAVGGAVHDAVGGAVRGAVGDAVGGAVHDAVRGAVRGAVDDAVRDAVGGAVRDAVHGAVGDAVGDAVGGAVGGAVHDAVRDAVGGAVKTIEASWWRRLWGNLWPYWQAYNSYFRDVCDLHLDGDLWDRARAYEDLAKAAGWSWPHRDFVMICDRPVVLHLEQVGPRGWGSHRLHCETGPAVAWRDGWALHYWHGVRVPADLIEGPGWDVTRILREPNAEVRRCAIERVGWDRFVADAQLTEVGRCPDPGNPGHCIALFDLPERLRDLYEEPARILLCTNGTPERDGTRRRFGLPVPAHHVDPVAAAAELYGWPTEAYRRLEVRT